MVSGVKKVLRTGLFITLFLLGSGVASGQQLEDVSWRQTNGPEGGRASTFFEHDGNLFVGTHRGGLFRSTDDGQSWMHVGLWNTTYVSAIVESPAETLIAATGEGIYRSTDGGATWKVVASSLLSPPGPFILSTVALDPDGRLLAGGRRLHRSSDDGMSWEEIQPPNFPAQNIDALESAPSGQLYMLAWGTLYRYNEVDDSWMEISNYGEQGHLRGLAVLDSTTLFTSSYDPETDTEALLRTTDSGQTWELTALGAYTHLIDIDGAGRIFAGTNSGVFRSSDLGETWEHLELPDSSVSMIGTYGEDNVIVGLQEEGLFQSEDAGETWREMNKGFVNSTVFTTAIDAQGRIFAGTTEGVFRSTDAGISWESYGLEGFITELLVTPSGNLFARAKEGLYRSSTETMNWQLIEAVPALHGLGHCLAIGPDGSLFGIERVLREDDYLWRSDDGGETWQSIQVPSAYTLTIHPNGDIFLGDNSNDPQGIYRSSDDGQTWEQLINGLYITSLVVDEAGRIFAGTIGGSIFRSTDGGDTWQSVAAEVEGQIESLVVWEGKLFAGSAIEGVFVTEDGGDTWISLNTTLANTSIRSLSIDREGYLVAGTYGSGVWRTETPAPVGIEDRPPETFSDPVLQGYPNPFHSGTTLAFTLSVPTPVRLSVYDIMGREVAVLLEEQKASGYHTAPFNAGSLPSGVYFVTLNTPQGTFREQLLLVR